MSTHFITQQINNQIIKSNNYNTTINQLIIIQSINQIINQLINQSINQSIIQSINIIHSVRYHIIVTK